MAERARGEPIWPLFVVLGVVAGALALGTALTGERAPDAPALAPEQEADPEPGIPAPGDRVRVEVLNGGGITGAAASARDRLREGGFDVVYYGNAASFGRDSSVVLVRTGRDGAAGAVGEVLGVTRIRSEPDSSLLVDVTVLLGRDWGIGEAADPLDARPAERPWWDPRRLLGPSDG